MRLYQKNLVAEGKGPPPAKELLDLAPMRLTLALLYDLSCALSEDPYVFRTPGDPGVTVQFRGSCYACEDFFQAYQGLMAVISHHWPMTVLGTVSGTEVGELQAELTPTGVRTRKSNVSGRNFAVLSDLCIQVETVTGDDGDLLEEALAHMTPQHVCLAVHRRFELRCLGEGLTEPINAAHFCYLSLTEETENHDRLECLSMNDKAELWESYLTQGLSPLEFEWLMEDLKKDIARGLLEWELTLQAVLPRLGIAVENGPQQLRITGADGAPMRLGYNSAQAAGKLFLKILFPVKVGGG